MPNTQYRSYFEARLSYSQTQIPTENISHLETLAFGDLKSLLNKIDAEAEKKIPNYWQTTLAWHKKEGTESLGERRPATGIMMPMCQPQETPEEGAKQTLLMIERYLASKAI